MINFLLLFRIKQDAYSLPERLLSPSSYQCEESGSKIPCGVDGIATIKPKRHSYDNHNKTDTNCLDTGARIHVTWVCYCHDANEQESCAKNLIRKSKQVRLFYNI